MNRRFFWIFIIIVVLSGCGFDDNKTLENRPILQPEVWLELYNEAWAVCEKQVPSKYHEGNNYLNPEEDIAIMSRLLTERSIEIERKVAEEFPELYQYTKVPEYREVLLRQGQAVYNQLLYQNMLESRALDADIDNQEKRDAELLEREKERMDRFLKDYKAPDYVP